MKATEVFLASLVEYDDGDIVGDEEREERESKRHSGVLSFFFAFSIRVLIAALWGWNAYLEWKVERHDSSSRLRFVGATRNPLGNKLPS